MKKEIELIEVEGAEGIRFRTLENKWIEYGKKVKVPNTSMLRKMIKEGTVLLSSNKKAKKGSK
jgi:hypothetical protein|tara:strand:- start:1979 stop:2167 length:189 start_codon:yes stop_codon:yes gene_type:complete